MRTIALNQSYGVITITFQKIYTALKLIWVTKTLTQPGICSQMCRLQFEKVPTMQPPQLQSFVLKLISRIWNGHSPLTHKTIFVPKEGLFVEIPEQPDGGFL